MVKLKDIIGLCSYWVYGGGPGHYNTSATENFKLHRAFVSNYVVTQGNLDLRVEPTWQNFKYDTYLQQLKDKGIQRIWCTQGTFDWFNQQGKQGKVMPVRDGADAMDQANWYEAGELCRQVAIRYAKDTAQHLDKAKVYNDPSNPTHYLNNVPKAGLDLISAIEIQNEWDFKNSWSQGTRTITPEEYAVCFKVCYDAIRSVSPTIPIIMGGGISPVMSTFERFLTQLDKLYQAEGKTTPNDFYLCFHWYMRNGSSDQGGGTAGITPEDAKAYEFGKSLDLLCEQRGLLGWYCTETGWATDTSKQSAPILQGFTREQSQGILMNRLTLIWGACKYHKGISFWHCRDDYDLPPYAKGGINTKSWTAKPARTICEEFISKYGEYEVDILVQHSGNYYVQISNVDDTKILMWSNLTNSGLATPEPKEINIIPEPTKMKLKVVNKKLQWDDGKPCMLVHADSPESRLKPGNELAFKTESELLPTYGINCITATMRGDDITQVFPWVTSSPSSGVDTVKLQKWHDQIKYFLDQCTSKNLRGVAILYLGERTNFNSITTQQYQQWIDAMAPIFSDIQGQLIFGWEEIWNNSAQGTIDFASNIGSYLKSKLPDSLMMVHNNPGQKPWSVYNPVIDLMCIQETSVTAMGASGVDAFNKGYAVNLHEWYGGFKVSNSQSANITALDQFLNQAKAETSGYGIFASDYDLQAPDATKLSYLYQNLSSKLNGGTIPPPQPTNMIIGYSTNRTDFKELIQGDSIPAGDYYVEAKDATPTVYFTLEKDGQILVNKKPENGAPYDLDGGVKRTFTNGNYKLLVQDKTGSKIVEFSVGQQVTTGKIEVTTTPQSIVTINNTQYPTPVSVDLVPGTYLVQFEQLTGYEPVENMYIVVNANQTTPVVVNYTPVSTDKVYTATAPIKLTLEVPSITFTTTEGKITIKYP